MECHIKCRLHQLTTYFTKLVLKPRVMSEVRIELRHTKTVVRQSQDETWSYETRAKTRHEYVETEPRQRRVNMCLETRRVSRDSVTGFSLTSQFFWRLLQVNRVPKHCQRRTIEDRRSGIFYRPDARPVSQPTALEVLASELTRGLATLPQ